MIKYLMLPLMLIYLIISENKFNIPLIGSSDFIYFIIIVFAFYTVFKSDFNKFFYFYLFYFPCKLISIYAYNNFFNTASLIFISLLFITCGAIIYGNNYRLLNKQLNLFVFLCVPIMLLQIIGVDPLFMMWDTSFLDDPLSKFSIDDVGYYKNFELYPTIFTSLDDLHYSIGQARPAGLTYNNNVLSIFIVLAIAINLSPRFSYRLKFSDYMVILCAVLSMSKMVFISMAMIYFIGLLLFEIKYKRLIIKMIFIFLSFLFFYYLIFPGLFLSNLSLEMILPSLLIRMNSFLYAINATDLYEFFYSLQLENPSVNMNNEVSKTIYSDLASSNLVIFLLPLLVSIIFMYRRGMISLGTINSKIYFLLLIACFLTQFGVSFYIASSFQLILGCALYPLFYYFKDNKLLVSCK